ncbi:Gag-pol Polyprotein [Phytophthora megakarya]|uniref:Gag-pol Polyprotein n=1 Tax=Phytophthora megakarya TaxID=4795 RepID=A0A225VLZ7_9STRA|nr:Gag-pol Polyprotein [Phytophthora megakarya]
MGLHVHQMDVSTAFLNGFRHDDSSTVCKLKKSLYSLNNHRVFVGGKWSDPYSTYRRDVDDITIAASNMKFLEKVKAQLASRFTMKDLGDIHYLLKMEINRDRANKILSMSQHKYIMVLLKK